MKKTKLPTRVAKGYGVMLRTVDADRRAYNGFRWPKVGPVKAPDWSPRAQCGGGLHGCLWGQGNGIIGMNDETRLWQAVLIRLKDAVDLGGKVKVPRGRVLMTGKREAVCAFVASLAPPGVGVPYTSVAAGKQGTASAGDRGQASAGAYGQASAGAYGQASAGAYGQASAGYGGQASAGDGGYFIVRYWDSKLERWRPKVGEVGIDGIKPDQHYAVKDGAWVEVAAKPKAAKK